MICGLRADLKRETDCDELRRVSAGIELVGQRGKNVIMALTSPRSLWVYYNCEPMGRMPSISAHKCCQAVPVGSDL
jgi:hypothetical protein